MITHMRTFVVQPGKLLEFIPLAKETQAVLSRIRGGEVTFVMAVGGDPMTVGFTSSYASLAEFETLMAKLPADTDYRAYFKKTETFVVPGSYRDQIWRHV
jgi:hypothetical protein